MDKQLKPFFAGFDLAGKRLENGKLQSYGLKNGLMDDWPTEVKVFGHTYTLEEVIKGRDGYESALYV